MRMEEQLKDANTLLLWQCPFCGAMGGDAVRVCICTDPTLGDSYWVHCIKGYGGCGAQTDAARTPEDAAKLWNGRRDAYIYEKMKIADILQNVELPMMIRRQIDALVLGR